MEEWQVGSEFGKMENDNSVFWKVVVKKPDQSATIYDTDQMHGECDSSFYKCACKGEQRNKMTRKCACYKMVAHKPIKRRFSRLWESLRKQKTPEKEEPWRTRVVMGLRGLSSYMAFDWRKDFSSRVRKEQGKRCLCVLWSLGDKNMRVASISSVTGI